MPDLSEIEENSKAVPLIKILEYLNSKSGTLVNIALPEDLSKDVEKEEFLSQSIT